MDTYIFTLDVFATDIKNKVSIVFVNFGLGASDNVILTFGKLTNCCFCVQFISYTPFPTK